jgi:hypothetical protein
VPLYLKSDDVSLDIYISYLDYLACATIPAVDDDSFDIYISYLDNVSFAKIPAVG